MDLHVEDGCYVLCPFCSHPLSVDVEAKRRTAAYYGRGSAVVPCNSCGFDVTLGNAVRCEIAEVERRTMPSCLWCPGQIAGDALVCAHCKRWTDPKTASQREHNAQIDRVMPPLRE